MKLKGLKYFFMQKKFMLNVIVYVLYILLLYIFSVPFLVKLSFVLNNFHFDIGVLIKYYVV